MGLYDRNMFEIEFQLCPKKIVPIILFGKVAICSPKNMFIDRNLCPPDFGNSKMPLNASFGP